MEDKYTFPHASTITKTNDQEVNDIDNQYDLLKTAVASLSDDKPYKVICTKKPIAEDLIQKLISSGYSVSQSYSYTNRDGVVDEKAYTTVSIPQSNYTTLSPEYMEQHSKADYYPLGYSILRSIFG
jgi:hypothetical protein